jgi:L-iditol 2-dehydrogenase
MAPSLAADIQALSLEQPSANPAKSAVSCCSQATNIEYSDVDWTQVENPSLQVTASHTIKMLEAPILRPGTGEVLLHIKATGICG